MTDHTYVLNQIVGTSTENIDRAIRNGIERASRTLRNLDWFEVVEARGVIRDGQVGYYQVTLKVGFRIDEDT
jgi:flavin-binding protein dodecin